MRVYVVTHPEIGLVGVFATEGDWEHYLKNETIDESEFECEWCEVYRRK